MLESIIITGATGFIGRHLLAHILDSEDDIRVVAQHSPSDRFDIVDDRVTPVAATLDQLSGALLAAGIEGRFATAYHFAARITKAARDEDVDGIIESNIIGTQAVLRAVGGRAERFVFASTLDVYGDPTGVLSESSALAPVTVYAASKLMGEVLVQEWARVHSAEAVVLRIGHLYGPGEASYGKLIPVTIASLLEGKPAVLFGTGEELRDLLYVGDAAAMIRLAGRRPMVGRVTTINLVSGRSYRVVDVLEMLRSLTGSDLAIQRLPTARKSRSFEFDSSSIQTWLDPGRPTSLEEGLRREVEWFRRTTA